MIVHVESVALAAEACATKGRGAGNLVVERLTCGHFTWRNAEAKCFTVPQIAKRIGKLRRCAECDGSVDSLSHIVLNALDAAPEKQTFGEPW